MNDEFQDLDGMLGFLGEDGRHRRDPEEHPSPEELSAYQAGELTPEEDERIQDHLAVCGHCTELLLDLEEFLEPATAAGVPADFEAAADWKRPREGTGHSKTGQESILPIVARHSFFASARGGYSVAAALLAVTVGLGIWSVELTRERRKPQPISEERTLFAGGSSRGGGEIVENEPIILPTQITLLLPTETPASLYKVDFLGQGSRRPEWSIEVRPNKREELNVLLPRKALLSGSYTLRVTPLDRGKSSREVWSYELRVSQPAH